MWNICYMCLPKLVRKTSTWPFTFITPTHRVTFLPAASVVLYAHRRHGPARDQRLGAGTGGAAPRPLLGMSWYICVYLKYRL